MNSRNQSDGIFDLSLNHTLKNWVDRKSAPTDGRDRLLVAALQQDTSPKSDNSIKKALDRLFHSKATLSEKSVFPGYGNALDNVFVIRARMTVA
jgi:hypothetical protein